MLEEVIISLVDNTEWISLMVIQHKKIGYLKIYVNFRELNKYYKHDPFFTLFTEDILKNVAGNKVYSIIDGFFGYHQVQISKEYQPKLIFTIKWGSFMYNVIPFRLKNASTIFSQIMIQLFKDFMHDFLEVYMDDWIVYNIMKNHTQT